MSTTIEWCDVPGYAGYQVTADGRMRGPSGRELRPMSAHYGHLYILTRRPGVPRKLFVHRAVMLAFGPPGEGLVRHLDDDPKNNRIGNLAWGTHQDNADDCTRNGGRPWGERAASAKLSAAQVREIRSLHGKVSLRALAQRFGVSHTAIRRAAIGTKWGNLR